MDKGIEKERIKIIYKTTQEIENMSIDHLCLKDGTRNAMKRIGLYSVGDILNNWDGLTNVIPREGKSGIGVTKEKEIHASVFAFLCELGCIKRLQY